MQVEVIPADRLIQPLLGDGGLTYEGAREAVQALLDRSPRLADVAAKWRAGAKDDTVFVGPFTWTVFEYDGPDPRPAAVGWLEDYARPIRAAGLDVQVARLPD